MTHTPFIAASYAAALLVAGWFGVGAQNRLRRADARLRALAPTRDRDTARDRDTV